MKQQKKTETKKINTIQKKDKETLVRRNISDIDRQRKNKK